MPNTAGFTRATMSSKPRGEGLSSVATADWNHFCKCPRVDEPGPAIQTVTSAMAATRTRILAIRPNLAESCLSNMEASRQRIQIDDAGASARGHLNPRYK